MDKYMIAESILSEGYNEDYLRENVIEALVDIAIAMTLGTTSIGSYSYALTKEPAKFVKKIKDKVEELANKKYEGKNAMQRVRIKLADEINKSNDFIYHVYAEVIKDGNADKTVNVLAPRLKLDSEEKGALNTYLTSIVHKIRPSAPASADY